jgi:CheY-like chemotaxis protein
MLHRQTQNLKPTLQENDSDFQSNACQQRDLELCEKDKSLLPYRMTPTSRLYHVLVVHHHPNTLHMMAAMFRKFEYQVSTAIASAKALIYFRQKTYDLLFTDLEMPVLDGYHLACLFKQHSPQTKAVIMTCRCQAELVGLMKDDAVDGWLFKPFKTRAFRKTLFDIGLGTQPDTHQSKR